MKGDYSRIPFNERKKMQHYRKVYHQQGKVLLDSDLNENTDLLHYQMKTLVKDGLCGSPNIGFRIGRGVPLLPVDDHRYIGEEGKGWSCTNDGTLTVDYFEKFEGKGSLKLENAAEVSFTFQKPVDLSKYRYLRLALKLDPSNDKFPLIRFDGINGTIIGLEEPSDQNGFSVIKYVFPLNAVLDNITKVILTEIDTKYHLGAVECSPPMFTLEPMTQLKGWSFDTDTPESAEISVEGEVIQVSQITRLYKRHFSTVDFSKFETMEFIIKSNNTSHIQFYVSDKEGCISYWNIEDLANTLEKYSKKIDHKISQYYNKHANLDSIIEYGFRGLSDSEDDYYHFGSILYEMSLGNNFVISGKYPLSGETGRLYVDGELYEKEEAETYLNQKDCPWAPSITEGQRTDLVYVDVWQRHVTSAEDPELREVAVGVDTCNRMKAVAQVKVLEGSTSLPPDLRPTGECTLSTAVEYMEAEKLCEITPGVEYTGLENRLYRVEIHAPETYKWSRNNASTVSQIIENVKEGAASVKVKEVKLFEIGDIIEITDDWVEFADRKYYLSYLFSWDDITGNDEEKLKEFLKQKFGVNWVTTAQIVQIDNGKTIMVSFQENYLSLKLNDEQTEVNLEIDDGRTDKFVAKIENSKLNIYYSSIKPWGELRKITSIDRNKNELVWDTKTSDDPLSMIGGLLHDYTAEGEGTTHPRVIKWDGANNTSNEEILEDEIKIRFSGSDMLPGDYWTFTARENTRTVERLVNELPQGVVHRYYPLATIEWENGEIINVTDLRTRFEPLCGLTAADLGFDNANTSIWTDAENVQQALESITFPKAEVIKFTNNCTDLYGTDNTNVQAALDNLCNGITVPSLTLKGKDGEEDNWPKLECSDERNLVEINKGLQIVTGELKAPFFKAGQGNKANVNGGGWYRIAENNEVLKRANAEFTLRDYITAGQGNSTLTFRIGISYNDHEGMSFTVLNHSRYSDTTFTRIRILKKGSSDTQYLEVFVNLSGWVDYSIYDNLQKDSWKPVNWEEVSAIPEGYDDIEFDVDNLFVVGDYENRFIVERGGNVGIGTQEPRAGLDIVTYGSKGWFRLGDEGKAVWVESRLWAPLLVMSALHHPPRVQFQQTGSGSEDNPQFASWIGQATNESSDLAFMGGNVGIGTQEPGARLDIANMSQSENKWFRLGDGGDGGRLWVEYGAMSAPLLVMSDKDEPPRIQFQQTGDDENEDDPQFISWIGHAKGRSSDLAFMGGNVGIGTYGPKNKLDVEGGAAIGNGYSGTKTAPDNGLLVEGKVGIGTSEPGAKLDVRGDIVLRTAADGSGNPSVDMVKITNNVFLVPNQGNVSIGITKPKNKLDVSGAVVLGEEYSGNRTAPADGLLVQGNVGIGTKEVDHDLQIGNAETAVSMSLRGPDGNSESGVLAFEDNNGTNQRWFKLIHDSQNNLLKVTSKEKDPIITFDRTNGNVDIGGSHTYLSGSEYEVEIGWEYNTHWIMGTDKTKALGFKIGHPDVGSGSTKEIVTGPEWIKNFLIHHPLDPEHKNLIHSTLEGPEVGVFYRGEAQLSNGEATVLLPDYFEALTRKENRTILLTPKFEGDNQVSMLAVSGIKDGKFTVKMIDRKNSSQKFYWEVKAVRADVDILKVERMKTHAE